MIIMQKAKKIRKHMIIHTGISIREPLQRDKGVARRGVVTTAHVEGNAEIQTEMKLAVWIYQTLCGSFSVLESDGIGTQEHVESCRVEA